MDSRIVDATAVEARRPHLNAAETTALCRSNMDDWPPKRRAQVDRRGRSTIGRGHKRPASDPIQARRAAEIAVPTSGDENIVAIDREHGPIHPFAATLTAQDDGRLARLPTDDTASGVLPGTTCRSAADLRLLDRFGLFIRTGDLIRTRARLTLADRVFEFHRLARVETAPAPVTSGPTCAVAGSAGPNAVIPGLRAGEARVARGGW